MWGDGKGVGSLAPESPDAVNSKKNKKKSNKNTLLGVMVRCAVFSASIIRRCVAVTVPVRGARAEVRMKRPITYI
jgi:hypothetical protein